MFAAPESELLRRCARKTLDPETTARIRGLVRGPIDWGYLIRLAHAHGMKPLLHWHLNALGLQEVPVDIHQRLRDDFQSNSRRNLFLTGKLLELLQLLRAHSIPAVPYKGPFLAQYLYGNLALRQFVDLDILVPRDRAAQARDLVASLGYPLPGRRAEHKTEKSFLRWEWEFGQISSDESFRVEIQWAFAPYTMSFPIQFESLLPRLQSTRFGGTEVLCLRPSDLLLVLCAHGAKHRWERLEWICGISELIRGYQSEIDWNEVIDSTEKLGIRRMTFLGLSLGAELLGAPVPEEVHRAIRGDSTIALLSADVSRRSLSPPREAGLFAYFLFQVRSRERWADKMRYLGRYLLKPRNAAPAILRAGARTVAWFHRRPYQQATPGHVRG
ncbi:MAG: nucleotidyltransferase family protein [Gemmatimonadaceae bacterium]